MNKNAEQTEQRLKQGFWAQLAVHIIRYRWLWLAGVLGICIFFAFQVSKVKFDNSDDIWFVEDAPILKTTARFNDAFGNDDYELILFTEQENPFTPATFQILKKLADRLMEKVPYAHRVTWLGNAERITGSGKNCENVVIEDFFPVIPETQGEIRQKLQEALKEPDFVNNLISEDGAVLVMMIELGAYPGEEEDTNPEAIALR